MFQVLSYNWTQVSCPGSCFFWTLLSSEPLGERKVSLRDFTLQLQVQGLQFQQQQHIYLRFEPAGWSCLYGTDYLDLCCKAPSGESPGERKKKGKTVCWESCIKALAHHSKLLGGRGNDRATLT